MDVTDLVRNHYGEAGLGERILSALGAAGTDLGRLTAADLHPVDQLHAGGAAATAHLVARLDLAPGARVLDGGCGIGGPARMAAQAGARVTGVDLSSGFVAAATMLSQRVGLADRTRFETTAGERLPHDTGSFDAALMVHVGMNVPDKQSVFAEVHRVLSPGAPFAVYDQVRTGTGEPGFPLPWAVDARSSFVETPEDYVRQLEAVGFAVVDVEDRTASTLGPAPAGPLSPATVFGPVFGERIGNYVAATRAGVLGAVLFLVRA